jgi:hypothetical protein
MASESPRNSSTSGEGGWTAKEPLRDVRGRLGFVGALLYTLLSLQWLRAPRWKNKAEARSELARLVARYGAYRYEDWEKHVGQRKDLYFTAPSGIPYQARFEPYWEVPGDVITVSFSIHDGGIGEYFPLTQCISLPPFVERP